ncbi:class I SAM-dependent methyltransferase [Pseudodesulfovibrio thermohalotolerans]|uniref:class I SAM-dependent methyltransferase n=1 Tax=Pseudodesulfovibrio thermohalotolerans TaxID=2880651 RepID=UPI0024429ABD|nr:class I SAM-dependent methyltransferase [Pseudodesulfovibrio thermohalotolerans]WFS61226.1 class I SAM-dependent methyltransferase [Pseudodesulfovibrio thermohalotolerans]
MESAKYDLLSEDEQKVFKKNMEAYKGCFGKKLSNKIRPVFKALNSFQGRPGLDVGCGGGGLTCALAQKGFNLTGIDLSDKSIKAAHALSDALSIENVDFVCADIHELKGKMFDYAYSFDVYEHIAYENHVSFLKVVYDALSNTGVFFIRTPHLFNIRQHIPGHIGLPTYRELMDAARQVGFTPKILVGHSGFATSLNYAVPIETFLERRVSNAKRRYTFLKYFSLANVVVRLEKNGD